jgi:hypothetical protein
LRQTSSAHSPEHSGIPHIFGNRGRLIDSKQVLRYSALAVGVAYGFYHQRKITQHVRHEQAMREYKRKEQLIQQAKAEYAKLKQPASAKKDSKAGRMFLPKQTS